ncbi:MAG: hypothetical protein M1812_006764 [Candelaria pacifica]|nr:MAG: hypothetical protein M1812_006764 [Candelaria pacifica]
MGHEAIPSLFQMYQSFPQNQVAKPTTSQSYSTQLHFVNNQASSAPYHIRENATLTALQQHVLFWDRNGDGIITPPDIYTGFRSLGFSIPYSIAGLLINFFFSYPTRLAYSYFPDPLFRIYIPSIHKAKHGSDTGIYSSDGHFRPNLFEELFDKFDASGTGGLGVNELFALLSKDRVAADPAGWSFAFMEWGTTWLLLQRGGKVWKQDLKQAYDGSLFYRIRDDREREHGWRQGYGMRDFWRSLRSDGTWKDSIKKSL